MQFPSPVTLCSLWLSSENPKSWPLVSHLSVRVMHRILHFECMWIFSSLTDIEQAATCVEKTLWYLTLIWYMKHFLCITILLLWIPSPCWNSLHLQIHFFKLWLDCNLPWEGRVPLPSHLRPCLKLSATTNFWNYAFYSLEKLRPPHLKIMMSNWLWSREWAQTCEDCSISANSYIIVWELWHAK